MNIISVFDGNVRKTPEKACVRFAGETITYAQAQQPSRQALHRRCRLRADRAPGPGRQRSGAHGLDAAM